MKNPLRELFIKYKWSEKKNLKIVYRNRGTPNNISTVYSNDVKDFSKANIIFYDGEEKYIPYHRVLMITDGDKLLYEKTE
jgi:uncharacterized protein (UPF0248 family)